MDNSKSISSKWRAIFQKRGNENLTNMFKIVSFVLSVPGSKALMERISSLMAIKLSHSWKRCSTELSKNDLQISVKVHVVN